MLNKRNIKIIGILAIVLWIITIGLGVTNIIHFIINALHTAQVNGSYENYSHHNILILGFIPFVDGRLDFGSTTADIFGYLAIIASIAWVGLKIWFLSKKSSNNK